MNAMRSSAEETSPCVKSDMKMHINTLIIIKVFIKFKALLFKYIRYYQSDAYDLGNNRII